jgi:hypothetical protein
LLSLLAAARRDHPVALVCPSARPGRNLVGRRRRDVAR